MIAGLSHPCSTRTVQCEPNNMKKEMLSKNDQRPRMSFAHKIKNSQQNFGENEIIFYLDGVSFHHKYDPKKEGLHPRCMLWRKPDKRLLAVVGSGIVGNGGSLTEFFLDIAYNREIVLCEQMPNRKITGESFDDISRSKFR